MFTDEAQDPDKLCDNGADPQNVQTVRATTAGLLAGRFPYLTPSGAMRQCEPRVSPDDDGNTESTRTTYVVDGGYVENTGLLTLLQTWDGLADRVTACNNAAGRALDRSDGDSSTSPAPAGCPVGADGQPLVVEPWIVLLENHYRTFRAPVAASRPHELWIPPTTLGKRKTTLTTEPLEQAAAIVASRRYGYGVYACNRFVRIAPEVQAAVEAPLGWVLAQSTRDSMVADIQEAIDANFGTPPSSEVPKERSDSCP